MLQDRSRL